MFLQFRNFHLFDAIGVAIAEAKNKNNKNNNIIKSSDASKISQRP